MKEIFSAYEEMKAINTNLKNKRENYNNNNNNNNNFFGSR